jgi:hypothetical protein
MGAVTQCSESQNMLSSLSSGGISDSGFSSQISSLLLINDKQYFS